MLFNQKLTMRWAQYTLATKGIQLNSAMTLTVLVNDRFYRVSKKVKNYGHELKITHNYPLFSF